MTLESETGFFNMYPHLAQLDSAPQHRETLPERMPTRKYFLEVRIYDTRDPFGNELGVMPFREVDVLDAKGRVVTKRPYDEVKAEEDLRKSPIDQALEIGQKRVYEQIEKWGDETTILDGGWIIYFVDSKTQIDPWTQLPFYRALAVFQGYCPKPGQ
ncbi:MAG: hypothetical protein V1735_06435 [Nanoarchaeota archaeon]